MSLFQSIFSFKSKEEILPDIEFGRFSDSFKTSRQYHHWDKSLSYFESKDYLKAFANFFDYLNDKSQKNVQYSIDRGTIKFTIYQGSKVIEGWANHLKFFAETKVASTGTLEIGYLRKLIEKNYSLKYNRFALDKKQNITLVFMSFVVDASPYKLYYALREMAVNADKIDDILISEFSSLKEINTAHVRQIDEAEKNIKYEYFHAKVTEVLDYLDNSKLNIHNYPGAASYLLLQLSYKIDYLLKPEGFVMDKIAEIQSIFFSESNKSVSAKNDRIVKIFKQFQNLSRSDFHKEIYEVTSCFGISTTTDHSELVNFIDSELSNMAWYRNNNHEVYAAAIPDFIVSYSLHNFGLPKPDAELLALYLNIVEEDFFETLGFTRRFCIKKRLNASNIKHAIKQIVSRNQEDYPNLNPSIKMIDFKDHLAFRFSYLKMIRQIDVKRKLKKID